MAMREDGFTLVEVAIVLVIVGLLLGGILKGQELIVQARVKNAIADFTGVSAAYYGYQDRYRAIPGDDPGAGRWAGATTGDGNRVVEGAYNALAGPVESRLWWDHLRRAGFVQGNGARQPFNALSGMVGVQTGDAAGATTLGGFSRLIVCSANLPDKIAGAVDAQMDDGAGTAGTLRALAQSTPNPTIDGTTAPADYVESGTNVYTLCREVF